MILSQSTKKTQQKPLEEVKALPCRPFIVLISRFLAAGWYLKPIDHVTRIPEIPVAGTVCAVLLYCGLFVLDVRKTNKQKNCQPQCMNAQKKWPNASFEEKSCWFECRWPLERTAPCAWRRLPATTEGTETCGGKTPAASGGRNLRKTRPPPLRTVTPIRDSPPPPPHLIFIWLGF